MYLECPVIRVLGQCRGITFKQSVITFSVIVHSELYNLKSWYCGMFVRSKNCGARETAVASERLWNNIRFYATAAKQTRQTAVVTQTSLRQWTGWVAITWESQQTQQSFLGNGCETNETNSRCYATIITPVDWLSSDHVWITTDTKVVSRQRPRNKRDKQTRTQQWYSNGGTVFSVESVPSKSSQLKVRL
jgi:hypothetical protein